MIPDAAGCLLELAEKGLVQEHLPQVAGRNPYNFLLSYKGQRSSGTAKQKIDKEIMDLGHWCDVDRVVAAVILDMPGLTESELAHLYGLGERHAVAVLTKEEVRAGLLPGALVAVAQRRRRLYNRIGPRGGYRPTKRFDRVEQGYVERCAARRDIRTTGQV